MVYNLNSSVQHVKFMKSDIAKWYLVDVAFFHVGRIATAIVNFLLAKHLVNYTFNHLALWRLIVLNTDKLILSGDKLRGKKYIYHTGYCGGFKSKSA